MKHPLLACGLAACLVAPAVPTFAADCGSQTVVVEGETLSDVAARCDVTVDEITDANPALVPGTVRPGTEIALPGPLGGGWTERAKGALRSAGEEIQDSAQQAGDRIRDLSGRASEEIRDAADRAGQSVSDYLKDHPELDANLRDAGARVGIPGVEAPNVAGPDIIVTPASASPGESVTITASGLPGGTEVTIGAGAPETEPVVIDTVTTAADGTLEATVAMPAGATADSTMVFVVETSRVRLTSDPVTVDGQ
ncbi:LysM peptidoglycan-binding domain-containing protein [Amorphus sp. MBR-141]